MITIDLIQESIDVTGYQNVLAKSIAVPITLILALAIAVAIAFSYNARSSNSRDNREYYEPGDITGAFLQLLFILSASLIIVSIPMLFLSTKIESTPRGENTFFDRISYVAYDTSINEPKSKTSKEDFHDDIKEAINEKKDDLEKYGLDSDTCESHKRSIRDVSLLCGGDSFKYVHTATHDIHIAVGNTTEFSRDSMPRNHIEVKDGEELFWASLVIIKIE